MSSADLVWRELILATIAEGNVTSPHGRKTTERLAVKAQIDMRYPVITNMRRKLNYKFMISEALWILRGDNRATGMLPFNYAKYAAGGEHIQWAYGPKVVEQLWYIVETLLRDPLSRQAVMSIWRECPRYEPPCTLTLQFLLRNDKIHTIVNMRSSDLWLGFPYDVFAFTMITAMVSCMLREKNPAYTHTMGGLTLFAGSQHIYFENVVEISDAVRTFEIDEKVEAMDTLSWSNPASLLSSLESMRDAYVGPPTNFLGFQYNK